MPKKQLPLPNEDREDLSDPAEYLNFNKPDFVFTPDGRHTWRQEGPYLVCRSCILHHAVHIGLDKIMIGENEDGKPIIKERSELDLASRT